jgi:hypothetical protein
MPWVVFEPTIPAFERGKTFHILDGAATAIGLNVLILVNNKPVDSKRRCKQSESELLYDWRFTANQFVLATNPLRLTTSHFIFNLNT